MGFFSKRNEGVKLNSNEYESLAKKIVEISAKLDELEHKFRMQGTEFATLRGQFNRKLSGIKKNEIEEEETQQINSPVILPWDGSFKQYR